MSTVDEPRLTATNSAGFATQIGTTADPVIFTLVDGALHVMLVRRADEPFSGWWALPGGFVGCDEASHQTALRKLEEKTGLQNTDSVYIEQLRYYDAPGRDPRGWLPSAAYLGLVSAHLLPADHDDQLADWHPIADLPQLAFDHAQIIDDALERLRGKLWWSNIAMGLLPEQFTLTEARRVYEAIAGIEYHAGNFIRRMRSQGLVQAVDAPPRSEGRGRPAQLYEWTSREPSWTAGYGWGTTASGS